MRVYEIMCYMVVCSEVGVLVLGKLVFVFGIRYIIYSFSF